MSKGDCYLKIDIMKDNFKELNRKIIAKYAFNYILNGNSNYGIVIDSIDNKEIVFNRISAKEYVYGTNSKKLSRKEYNLKMMMAIYVDYLINNAFIKYSSPLTHKSTLFKLGFNNYQGLVKIDNIIFKYIVRIGRAKKDNIFYDISLEKICIEKGTDVRVPSTKNTSLIKISVPLTDNNIT